MNVQVKCIPKKHGCLLLGNRLLSALQMDPKLRQPRTQGPSSRRSAINLLSSAPYLEATIPIVRASNSSKRRRRPPKPRTDSQRIHDEPHLRLLWRFYRPAIQIPARPPRTTTETHKWPFALASHDKIQTRDKRSVIIAELPWFNHASLGAERLQTRRNEWERMVLQCHIRPGVAT